MMHRCTRKIKFQKKRRLDARDRALVCVKASVTASLFICVCAALRLHVTSVSWIRLQAGDSCGQIGPLTAWKQPLVLQSKRTLEVAGQGGGPGPCAPFHGRPF